MVLGLTAALAGGPLAELGSGPGGLFGLPFLFLVLVVLGLGIPGAIRSGIAPGPAGRRVGRAAVLLMGPVAVALGFLAIAHALDPCVNGWWDTESRLGSIPLCERFGPELNVHTRFHLLAHAAPAAALVVLYRWAIGKMRLGVRG